MIRSLLSSISVACVLLSAGCGANSRSGGATTGGASGILGSQGGSGQTGGTSGSGGESGQTGGAPGSGGGAEQTGGARGSGGVMGTAGSVGLDAAVDGPPGSGGRVSDGSAPANDGGGPGGAPSDGGLVVDPGIVGDGDFIIGPTFITAPEERVIAGVPRGRISNFTMSSATSPIYPGVAGAFTRTLSVYVPTQYVPGTEAPVLIVQDGTQYMSRIVPVLDNMINDRRIPALIGVFINPGPGAERSFEYDRVSDAYVNFIETEILPKVQTDYNVKITTNPEGRAAFGGSSGGIAAFGMAWFRPDLYRRILSYSGSFVNLAPTTMYPRGGWEFPEHLVADVAPKPLRVAFMVGELDNGSTTPATGFRNWTIANQMLAAVLKTKGYHYHYVFARGAGHVDNGVILQTMPEMLLWLWRGYPIP